MAVKLNLDHLNEFIKDHEYEQMKPLVKMAHETLQNKFKNENKFTGWLDLPENYDKDEFNKIKSTSQKIQKESDALIVIGIGGSYLGARAAIEFIKSLNYNQLSKNTPDIYFVGNNISTSYIRDILKICENKDISINVISKSGTTTEPAVAFRIFREFIEKKYGKEKAKDRIYCTTDKQKGALKELATKNGYETFVIPDNIGGRFSVLTAVGLLPIAVAGIDIDKLMLGAKKAQADFMIDDLDENICYKYAVIRRILCNKGKDIEILESYEPRMLMFSEWFKQLFGESEGKEGKGIFPTSLNFSTDLHSMGQLLQSGKKNMFETVLLVKNQENEIKIPYFEDDIDKLNYLSDKNVSFVNSQAALGTILAHTSGNIPNLILELSDFSEETLGYLIYFFEKACAISCYMLGVNPFDQPGVELYKNHMFELLGKPGYKK